MPPTSRFSEEQIANMRQLYASGKTTTHIGSLYGIHRATVYDLLKQRGVIMQSRSQAKRQYTVREASFESVSDEHSAYWLGFLFADGCVVQRRGTGEVHLVLQKKDIPHLEKFRDFLASDIPIHKETNYDTYRLSVYSKKMADNLIRLGCTPRKSLTLSFPHIEFPLVAHFIRGYFDGDGSAYINGRCADPVLSFVGTESFLATIQRHIYRATQANGYTYAHSKSEAFYLVYKGAFQAHAVADWLYADATVWLERKKDCIERFKTGKRTGYPTANKYGTAGNVSAATIQRYIDEQKGS